MLYVKWVFTNGKKVNVNVVERENLRGKQMKELIVFTNNGQTYHFNGVTDFRPTTTGFSFNYFGKATQLTRSAVFNNTCVAGYALRGEKDEN